MQPGLFSNVSEVTVPENVAAYRREVVALEHGRITAMKTTESRKSQDHEVRTLRNDELDAVSGGTFSALSSAISEVMKNFSGALQTAARGG